MTYYIAMDAAGDSQDNSVCLGVFTSEERARAVLEEQEQRFKQEAPDDWWSRRFLLLSVGALDTVYPVDYTSDDPWHDNPFNR